MGTKKWTYNVTNNKSSNVSFRLLFVSFCHHTKALGLINRNDPNIKQYCSSDGLPQTNKNGAVHRNTIRMDDPHTRYYGNIERYLERHSHKSLNTQHIETKQSVPGVHIALFKLVGGLASWMQVSQLCVATCFPASCTKAKTNIATTWNGDPSWCALVPHRLRSTTQALLQYVLTDYHIM